jgi:hypothetical protein
MSEYCNKMTKHISKITERYIKMAYSKHKMTEYRSDGGLGMAARGIRGLVNAGSAHRSMQDESEACARSVAHGVGWAVRWLAGLSDGPIGPSL